MHDRPTAVELLEAVSEFLAGEILPALDDPRLRFRTLVALNALGIALRELSAPPHGGPRQEEVAELAARIRAGDAPNDAVARLKEQVAAKLRVSNPAALERYR